VMLERSKQLQDRGKLFRAYGAVPADSVQPEYRLSPSRSANQRTPRGARYSRSEGCLAPAARTRAAGAWHRSRNPDPSVRFFVVGRAGCNAQVFDRLDA